MTIMTVSVEISYNPLTQDYLKAIDEFIDLLSKTDLQTDVGKMSTVITGDYGIVMKKIIKPIGVLLERYPSVFNLKISNSCPV